MHYLDNLRRISVESWWFLFGTMLVSFAWLTFMLLFNLYMKERGFPEGFMGRVLSAQSFGTMAMALPAAYLVSRVSARRLLILTSFGVALGFAWVTLGNQEAVIMIAAFCAGSMLAFPRVVSSPYLMKHTSPSERAHVFSLAFAASLGAGLIAHFGAGSLHRLLTSALGSSLAAYRWVMWIGCACAAAGALAFARIPAGVVGKRSPRAGWRIFWATKGPMLFRLTCPYFLVGMGAGLIIPFLNLYFRDRFELSTQTIGIYYGLVQAAMVLGVMLGPELARRFGMVRTIVVSELASLPFMAALAFTHNLPLATGAFLARGALMNLGVPISTNYMMERVGPDDRAIANSAAMLAWTGSWAITAGIGGWMIERWGYELPLLIAGALYLIASGMYFVFFRKQELHAGGSLADSMRPGDE
ncbi:MAG: MFS transporter [candidate division Zixibacteria bacterium]|nr:MFS transporter [candidate division Zixibacteria bacterium]